MAPVVTSIVEVVGDQDERDVQIALHVLGVVVPV
jgi:hypothetical protein